MVKEIYYEVTLALGYKEVKATVTNASIDELIQVAGNLMLMFGHDEDFSIIIQPKVKKEGK